MSSTEVNDDLCFCPFIETQNKRYLQGGDEIQVHVQFRNQKILTEKRLPQIAFPSTGDEQHKV
jgi:hypothetical protein